MEHPAIDEQDVAERYLRGRLPEAEALAFERHYLSCPRCLDRLEQESGFAAALRRTASRGLLQEPAPREEGRLLRFAGFAAPRPRWLALAALLLAAVALAFLAGRELLPRARAGGAFSARVEERLLPVFLGALRSGEGPPPVELRLEGETESWLLIYELPAAARGSGYRLRLLREGREVWRSGDLAANDLGLTVAVPRKLLLPGDYELEAAAPRTGGESILGRAAFRVR